MSLSIAGRRPRREQSRGEEIANSITHGVGLVLAFTIAPFLILHAFQQRDHNYIFGASLFAVAVVLLYFASTFYHALPQGKSKRVFRMLDHLAIYLLIAGTYTPFTLGVLRGTWGWVLFGMIWGLAFAGFAQMFFRKFSHPIVRTGHYLLMGWLMIFAIKPLVTNVPLPGILWLVGGGVMYTVGVAFFAASSFLKYGHSIWHVFVLAGTTCHYLAVLWYAA